MSFTYNQSNINNLQTRTLVSKTRDIRSHVKMS